MRGLVLMVFALLWSIVLVLTGGRFLALLAGLNPEADLIRALYDLSEFWVEPFINVFGLSNKAVEDTGGVFEPASLIAFAVYMAVGALVYALVSGAAFSRFRHA